MLNNKAKPKTKHLGKAFLALLSVPLLIGFIAIGSMIKWGSTEVNVFIELGPWGDFFGGVLNPALTFLAFIGVLITIVLQKMELSLTRDELERSAEALEAQTGVIEKQNFESTFFSNAFAPQWHR